MKSLVLAAVMSLPPVSPSVENYVISYDDEQALIKYEQGLDADWAVARCVSNYCYIIRTGEHIGEGPDGIYLVRAL